MLTLRSSPASPFGRKVRIAAGILNLVDRITIVPADTNSPEDDLRIQNPLGKIPVLVLEDGTSLYDSRVILEYLDHLAGGNKLIPAGQARFAAMTHQALFDGVMDASILRVYEGRWRAPEQRLPTWLEYQAEKVDRALAFAERNLSTPARHVHVGHIAQACALGYLDLRFEGAWRDRHPRLVAWLDDFSERTPSFLQTKFTG